MDFRTELVDCVRILSLSAFEQIGYLDSLKGDIDELALDFHDAYLMCSQMLQRREITDESFAALTALDQQLTSMSGQERCQLWTEDALYSSQEWVCVRSLARNALGSLTASLVELRSTQ